MRAIEIQGSFGLEQLRIVERPDPVPGPGEVLVRMRAASLNYRDLLMVRGLYNPRQALPLIPLSDGVGEVVALGAGVTAWREGDRVCGCFFADWQGGRPTAAKLKTSLGGPLDGTLSELRVFDERAVVAPPAHLSDVEAACLPCAPLTAWTGLVTEGRVKAGDVVLCLGTGGVSTAAIQIAKLMGCEVIVTSSSDEKLERAKALGADHGINYRAQPRWDKAARKLTDGRGVDHVVEVGGAGTFDLSMRALAPGGTMSLIGVLAAPEKGPNLVPILMQHIRVQGVIVGDREGFEAMNRAFAHHAVRPLIDHVRPWEEAAAALVALGEGGHVGKIVLAFAGASGAEAA